MALEFESSGVSVKTRGAWPGAGACLSWKGLGHWRESLKAWEEYRKPLPMLRGLHL